jgi:leucyl-tRNA synthetase
LIDTKNSEGKLKNLLYQTIADVTKFMSDMRFNTAIAKLIELNNELVALPKIPKDIATSFVLMLAPFAPHMCEELWRRMGNQKTIAYEPWPSFDEAALKKIRNRNCGPSERKKTRKHICFTRCFPRTS